MEITSKKVTFTKRPIPVPVSYRPMFKISEIVLVLKLCCRSETSDLLKLHLFSWAFKSSSNLNNLKNYVSNNFQGGFTIWGIEPALNRALQFAIADGICMLTEGKKYQLASKGESLYNVINKDKELFVVEKTILKFIGKNKITEARIRSMSQNWSLENDKD